jgi:hypothetical protein
LLGRRRSSLIDCRRCPRLSLEFTKSDSLVCQTGGSGFSCFEHELLAHIRFMCKHILEEIDIGDGTTPWPTFVNKNMSLEHKDATIKLLKDYVDCFAWNYHEMTRLSREIVEH